MIKILVCYVVKMLRGPITDAEKRLRANMHLLNIVPTAYKNCMRKTKHC